MTGCSRQVRRSLIASVAGAACVGMFLAATASPAQAARVVVPAQTAQTKVIKKVPGDVLSVKRAKRDGFTSWAVTIQRKDGSIVVGYVDVKSGIIFDWTVQRGPGEPVIDLDGAGGGLTPAKPPTDTTIRSATQPPNGDGSTGGTGQSGGDGSTTDTSGGGTTHAGTPATPVPPAGSTAGSHSTEANGDHPGGDGGSGSGVASTQSSDDHGGDHSDDNGGDPGDHHDDDH